MAGGGVRITFDKQKKVGRKLEVKAKKFTERHIKSVQAAARRAADEIEYAGRENIRAGGDFGSRRWIDGFRALVSYKSRADVRIRVTHAVKYWRVFEFGATILGKPLLWIPLDFGNSFGIRARDYPGKLFRVDRQGKAPLLIDPANGPQYFGKEQVTIPKKWNLREVTRSVSRRMGEFYREAMRDGR